MTPWAFIKVVFSFFANLIGWCKDEIILSRERKLAQAEMDIAREVHTRIQKRIEREAFIRKANAERAALLSKIVCTKCNQIMDKCTCNS